VADALHLNRLDREFDTALDCGLFHTFDREERRAYVVSLASVTARGARVYVLCFSNAGPDPGPHPISQEELRASFTRDVGWSVTSLAPDRIETRFNASGAPAWLAVIERIQPQLQTGSSSRNRQLAGRLIPATPSQTSGGRGCTRGRPAPGRDW
jgi:hypothetical protein